jgi:hypothetical protein
MLSMGGDVHSISIVIDIAFRKFPHSKGSKFNTEALSYAWACIIVGEQVLYDGFKFSRIQSLVSRVALVSRSHVIAPIAGDCQSAHNRDILACVSLEREAAQVIVQLIVYNGGLPDKVRSLQSLEVVDVVDRRWIGIAEAGAPTAVNRT